MPKGFSEREKEIIRSKLLEKGKEFLGVYGIRKTNVEDLTRAVGISKGAFYIFYDSKEELFFEILEQFEKEVRENVARDIFKPGEPPKESFRRFLVQLFTQLQANPIFKILNKEEFEYLLRKLPEEKIQNHMKNDDDFVIHFIEKLKNDGYIRDYKPRAVAALFRSLIYMILLKDEIAGDTFPELVELLADMISNYLVKE